ncbi:MAG: hypothetical protein A2W05_09025 [Candidatus Schekmanbacteria bacterium RBG_16_38_10]|uniref:Uncharacterized protein n=1 Tax=Candidatus Schekmanbacteria bacterium RBG_16_38_10 TaxID=1817879 RepID=A0A1F7RPK7_9BACT|nr:MAG: hypothetical protein A2W05_09025 [Candidatus Schekmanbacteria bacterium RBG_16_38_10]
MENSTKKRIQLKEDHIKYLSELPESGMGYQIVDITLKNGQQLNKRVVLNSQFLLLENSENIDPDFIEKVDLGKK